MNAKRELRRSRASGPSYARRTFLGRSLAALPALSLLTGCMEAGVASSPPELEGELALRVAAAQSVVGLRERVRRWRLALARVAAANRHDLARLMEEYASGAELVINGHPVTDRERIRQTLANFGLSAAPGSLQGTQLAMDQFYWTDEESLIYGRMSGQHVGAIAGFPGTQRSVSVDFAAFHRYDRHNRLVSERFTLNLGALNAELVFPGA